MNSEPLGFHLRGDGTEVVVESCFPYITRVGMILDG